MNGARALLTVGLACGCGSTHSVSVNTRVGVSISPEPRELPFDPRGARLVSAHEQLERIVGHPFELALDAAVSPESRSSFEEALIDAFTSIARDFDELRQADPVSFNYAKEKLYRVEVRYDATRPRDDITFNESARSVVIRGPAARSALVERRTVYFYLMRSFDQNQTRHFAHRTPDTVATNERYEYFRWLVNDRNIQRSDSAPKQPTAPTDAVLTLNVLRLAKLNNGRDTKLAERSKNWLIARRSTFVQTYLNDAKFVMGLPRDSIFNQAAHAWAVWAIATYPTLDDDTRLSLAKDLFVRSFGTDQALTHRAYPPFAWPGVDLFALGLTEADRWRASGHPTQQTKPRCESATDFFVCTRVYESGASVAPNCNEDWYRFALETQTGRHRLVSAMTARNDPLFTETVFKNVRSSCERPLDMMLVLLRELENDAANWNIGWRVFADDYLDSSFDAAALEESRRLWVTHPERRGILLSGLAHMDRGERGNVDWRGFASAFGNPISSTEFAAYLVVDRMALSDVFLVWPALGHRWSRAALIIPKLDSWLNDSQKRNVMYQDPYHSLQHIISGMCGERNTTDLGLMRGYLEQRRRTHLGEPYSNLIDLTREKECQPPPPPPPPRNEVRLSPLKLGLPPLRIIQPGAE